MAFMKRITNTAVEITLIDDIAKGSSPRKNTKTPIVENSVVTKSNTKTYGRGETFD